MHLSNKNSLDHSRLFLAGLAYLQYQQLVKINWDKLQSVSHATLSNLANVTTQISNNIGGVVSNSSNGQPCLLQRSAILCTLGSNIIHDRWW
jgi:hypothetical protein